jgi:DNA mismatch repair protein MutS
MEMGLSMNLNGDKDYYLTGHKFLQSQGLKRKGGKSLGMYMDIDKTTYEDLSIFNKEEEFSIFNKLNFTGTNEGRDRLWEYFSHPFSDKEHIVETQKILSLILQESDEWPQTITNGTLMVIDKFYETSLDEIPEKRFMSAISYKLLHGPDFSLVRYSLLHFADFVRGMQNLIEILDRNESPMMLRSFLRRAKTLMDNDVIQSLQKTEPRVKFSILQTVHYGNYARYRFKNAVFELMNIYGRLDAWYSMAIATKKYQFSFPVFLDLPQPNIDAVSLYHLLLPSAVSYDVQLNQQSNFLFLTGANMAGKSTLIKAVGTSVYLAHLGMGVPAKQMSLTLFDGILSNINVVDNIVKGESYFFNEVQRIKKTILKINNNGKWLVLIDELFKGTNVEDSMKCSSTVIKGLIKMKSSLFILSTHLYEIGDELKKYPNIAFKYFETTVKDDQLEFSYQLKEGISNDRLGYLILKREKVVEMLENL